MSRNSCIKEADSFQKNLTEMSISQPQKRSLIIFEISIWVVIGQSRWESFLRKKNTEFRLDYASLSPRNVLEEVSLLCSKNCNFQKFKRKESAKTDKSLLKKKFQWKTICLMIAEWIHKIKPNIAIIFEYFLDPA